MAKDAARRAGSPPHLLNRSREEMAKEYVTKTDSNQVLLQIMSKFDRLEEKIDRLMER